MKTISIKELHEATGRLVREARHGTVVVTDRGVKVALLKPYSAEDVPGRAFPKRRARDLPAVGVDSTVFISSDRDER